MAKNFMMIQGMEGIDAGATVYWTLASQVTLDGLRRAWQAEGLDPTWLPEAPSPEQKLSRAVRSMANLRTLARPLARRGHWAIVREEVHGEGTMAHLLHQQELTARILTGATMPVYSQAVQTDLTREIDAAFVEQEGLLDRDDVALWLVKVIEKRIYGTPLRPRGGFYYILPWQMPTLRAIVRAVQTAGAGQLYTLPTVAGEEATRAVLDALSHEIEGTAVEFSTAIGTGTLGKRALRARVADCDSLLDKLAQYEGLLGGALDKVRGKVMAVQDVALQAAFAAEAPDEEIAE
jgi:hypothetical protein